MKFERTKVWGFENALRGMRNPKNSWNKNDTIYGIVLNEQEAITRTNGNYVKLEQDNTNDAFTFVSIGENDLKLCQNLIRAGSEHRKFMRQIFVSVDITAPLYWWKEADQYRINVTTNSCSTMHKLSDTPITIDCFEIDDISSDSAKNVLIKTANDLEQIRVTYNNTKDKKIWKELIRLLPESWLQMRTITMNYENILSMVHQRVNHRLNEWSGKDNPNVPNFINWVKTLPYAEELIFINEKSEL